jgi:hypothetical protein
MSRRARVTVRQAMQWQRPGLARRKPHPGVPHAGSGNYHVVATRGADRCVLVSCRDALEAELQANHYRACHLDADEITVEPDAAPHRKGRTPCQ